QEGSALPPYQRTFKAGPGQVQSVEFQDSTDAQTFHVTGLPANAGFLLSALDAMSGEAVSSTAVLSSDGMATLRLMSAAPPVRLQIRPAQSYAGVSSSPAAEASCDGNTPAFASLSIDPKDLSADGDGVLEIALPAPPERIPYEGTVDLCAGQQDAAAAIG